MTQTDDATDPNLAHSAPDQIENDAEPRLGKRDNKDLICGGILLIFGIATVLYVPWKHSLGSFHQIGSGFLTTVMGGLIALFGIMLIISAFFRQGYTPQVEWRPLLVILAAIAAFALTLDRLGVIAAVIVLTLISTSADGRLSLVHRLYLAVALAAMAVIIFYVALNVPLKLVAWNW